MYKLCHVRNSANKKVKQNKKQKPPSRDLRGEIIEIGLEKKGPLWNPILNGLRKWFFEITEREIFQTIEKPYGLIQICFYDVGQFWKLIRHVKPIYSPNYGSQTSVLFSNGNDQTVCEIPDLVGHFRLSSATFVKFRLSPPTIISHK